MKKEWAIYDSDVGTLHLQPLIYGICPSFSVPRLHTRRYKAGCSDIQVKDENAPNASST
jgi:hypothetical protein